MPYPQDFPFGIMDVVELLHLTIRRRGGNSVYADCPFCGDQRGKMNINYVKNVWRCNYCDESGGMLALYAGCNNTTKSDAYREICDALQSGDVSYGYPANGNQPNTTLPKKHKWQILQSCQKSRNRQGPVYQKSIKHYPSFLVCFPSRKPISGICLHRNGD